MKHILTWKEGKEPAGFNGIVKPDTVRYSMTVDGRERAWEVYVPVSYTGEQKVPVIFCLHGASGFNTAKSPWPIIAERENLLVVYPEALTPWLWNIWNLKTKDGAPDDVAFLDYLVDWVQQEYQVDECRIYMQGNSMGDNMVSTYAYKHGNRLAAIAPTSGPTLPSVQCNERGEFTISPNYPLTIVRLHGDRDSKCGFPSTYGFSKKEFEEQITSQEQVMLRAMMDQMQKDQWNGINEANAIPELYFTDNYNLEIYRGKQANLYYYSTVDGEHSPDLEFYEIIWRQCFSGWRRVDGQPIWTGAEEIVSQDTNAVALVEGADKLYVGGRMADLPFGQRLEKIDNEWYVPASLLPMMFKGMKLEEQDGHTAVFRYKEKQMEIMEGQHFMLVDGRIISVPLIRKEDKELMVPVLKIAEKGLRLDTAVRNGTVFITNHPVKLTEDGARIIQELLEVRHKMWGDVSFEESLKDRILRSRV